MQMNDSLRLSASRERVWAALNNPDVLRQCIPGCQNLEMSSPTEMTATVVIKVGPVKATFSGKVTLSDIDPPNGYRITGEGSGGVAGFAKGGAVVRLEDAGGQETILHYEVNSQIGGKLAQLGARLIDSTAKKLAGQFFASFGAVVSGGGANLWGSSSINDTPANGNRVIKNANLRNNNCSLRIELLIAFVHVEKQIATSGPGRAG